MSLMGFDFSRSFMRSHVLLLPISFISRSLPSVESVLSEGNMYYGEKPGTIVGLSELLFT